MSPVFANERPQNKLHERGQIYKYINIYTSRLLERIGLRADSLRIHRGLEIQRNVEQAASGRLTVVLRPRVNSKSIGEQ